MLAALSSFKYAFLIYLLGKIIYLECCMYITEDWKKVLAKYNRSLFKVGREKNRFLYEDLNHVCQGPQPGTWPSKEDLRISAL